MSGRQRDDFFIERNKGIVLFVNIKVLYYAFSEQVTEVSEATSDVVDMLLRQSDLAFMSDDEGSDEAATVRGNENGPGGLVQINRDKLLDAA